MKIRSDFVTNSSSSSYMIVHVKNQVLCELMRSYKKRLGLRTLSKEEISLLHMQEEDCGSDTSCPTSYKQAVSVVWEILNQLSEDIPELRTRLEDAKADINICFEEIAIAKGYQEWGGDSDLRYDWDFPEGTRREWIDHGAIKESAYHYEAVMSWQQAYEIFGTRHFTNGTVGTVLDERSRDLVTTNINCREAGFHRQEIPISQINVRKIADKYKKAKDSVPATGNIASGDTNPAIAGKTFVITGDVHVFPNRNAVKTYIEANGGKLAGSVSSKTDYLINNDAASSSSKNVTAKKNNVPIITEDEFIEKFQVQIG